MVAMTIVLAAVLSTQYETELDARTMAAACRLAGLDRSTVPITASPDAPVGASRGIEGWTTFAANGKAIGVFAYTRSATFRCAAQSEETTTCLVKLASILVHEVWHFEHGADEEGAYAAQLTFLNKIGVPTRVLREVIAAHAAAVRADRNRIQIHRGIAETLAVPMVRISSEHSRSRQ